MQAQFTIADYRGKSVLVTGGAGFIGINLVKALCALGARVRVLDLPSADFAALPKEVEIVRGDLLDRTILPEAVAGADIIFHLAAKTDLSGRVLKDYAVNHEGTRHLLDALRGQRQLSRFVFFSTQLVVGIFNEKRFIGPGEPYRTKTLYGESKIAAEKVVVSSCDSYGIPYTILRPTSVYGPFGRQPYREFFLSITRRRYFHIGAADNLISMAYVGNVVDQALYLAGHEHSVGQVFYCNDFHPYTMREFSTAVAQHYRIRLLTIPTPIVYLAAHVMGVLKWLGLPMPLYPFRLRNIRANYCYDISNAVRLGFVPRYDLDEGIRATLDWYARNDAAFQAA
jgi:nucleoside-diphosphate-sugar epimerase